MKRKPWGDSNKDSIGQAIIVTYINGVKRVLLVLLRKTAAPHFKAPLGNMTVGSPMHFVSVDIVGPFPESQEGNKYILVAVDQFTKWSEAFPIPNQEASTVASVLSQEWFFRYSPSEILHSDQGRQFKSHLIQELCKIFQIKKTHTSPYHPQGDGTAERFNRTLLSMLAITAKNNPSQWQKFIRPVCMAYNSSIHHSTGFTPFFLMFGREARLPVDLKFGADTTTTFSPIEYVRQLQRSLEYAYEVTRSHLGYVQQRNKTLYDQKVHGKPFKVGDKVWLHTTVVPRESHKKLHHPWIGPYIVVENLSNVNYRIKSETDPEKFHIVHFD